MQRHIMNIINLNSETPNKKVQLFVIKYFRISETASLLNGSQAAVVCPYDRRNTRTKMIWITGDMLLTGVTDFVVRFTKYMVTLNHS